MMRKGLWTFLPLLLGLGLVGGILAGARISASMDTALPMSGVASCCTNTLTHSIYLPLVSRENLSREIHINVGGPTYYGKDGLVYLADQPYTPATGAGYITTGIVVEWHNADVHPMGGTRDKYLYADLRASFGEYRFDLPNGNYLVTLGLAAIFQHEVGQSAFDVAIESSPVLTAFDIFSHANLWYAIDIPFPVVITDTQLNVVLTPTVGVEHLNAIAVTGQKTEPVTPALPLDTRGVSCFNRVLFDWEANSETDLLGYRVRRTSLISGAEQTLTAPLRYVPYFIDDDVQMGHIYSYTVQAVNAYGQVSDASAPVTATAIPPTSTALPIYELTIAPEELSKLNANPWTDEYVPGLFHHDGVTYTVEVRYRGSYTNRNTPKKSWKIVFNESQLFQGKRVLNLYAEFNDRQFVRQKLGYDTFQEFGVDGPQARFVDLYLNGGFRGVYDQVEDIDEYFLLRTGRPVGSTIYKIVVYGDYAVLDNPDLYYSYYDKQTNTSTGYDDLIGFIEFINAVSDQEFPEAILQVFEVDSYLDYYATIILMGHSDVMTYYHNSFILHNPETGRWEVIPWDNGGAFGTFDLPIDHGTPRHVLLTRILDVPEYRLYYGRFLVEAMADAFTPEHIAEMTEGYRQQIDLDIQCDTWHRYWFAREFDPDRSQFVESRTAYLQSVVYSYTEGLTLPLTLDLTDTGDQLVLRNHGLLDWDVGGMTVQSQEWAWVLPKGTSVPAGGELVLWNALSEQGLLPSAIAPSTLDTLALLDKPVHRARPVAQWTRPTLWQHPVPPAE